MDSRKFKSGKESFELVPAEVVYTNYRGDLDTNLYMVNARLLYNIASNAIGTIVSAKPFDVSIKKLPSKGEIIYIMRGVSRNASPGVFSTENYYLTGTLSTFGNMSLNAMIGISNVSTVSSQDNYDNINNSNIGYTENKDSKEEDRYKYKPAFVDNFNMPFLQPYEGDIIYEGRSGNSIRFSSTSDNDELYSIAQSFGKGVSRSGDPILIIRNGVLPKLNNRFNVEKVDDDDISSIWMTRGQEIRFKNPSSVTDVQSRLEIDSYNTEEVRNSGNQVGIFSDRITISSKKKEINILSNDGISLSTNSSIAIESTEFVELNSGRINLGIDAEQPVLMGNDTVDLLSELISEVRTICENISKLTVGTGTGPSTPPVNIADFINNISTLEGINSKLESLKSDLVFLNKS